MPLFLKFQYDVYCLIFQGFTSFKSNSFPVILEWLDSNPCPWKSSIEWIINNDPLDPGWYSHAADCWKVGREDPGLYSRRPRTLPSSTIYLPTSWASPPHSSVPPFMWHVDSEKTKCKHTRVYCLSHYMIMFFFYEALKQIALRVQSTRARP